MKGKGNRSFVIPVFGDLRLVTTVLYTISCRFQTLFCVDFSILATDFTNRPQGVALTFATHPDTLRHQLRLRRRNALQRAFGASPLTAFASLSVLPAEAELRGKKAMWK
jgi:hypothetical protein